MLRTNRHWLGVLFAAMVLIAELGFAQSQYRFEHYSKKDGLGNDLAWSLAQDSLGYIWIQYMATLTSFDGYNFKVYRYDAEDTLTSALDFFMGRLVNDRGNNIWIPRHKHTKSETLLKHDRKTDGFIRYEIDVGGVFVFQRVFEPGDHSVWLGTDGKGLFRHDFSSGKTENFQNQNEDNQNADLNYKRNSVTGIKDLGSTLLLSTLNGLWVFNKDDKTFSRPTGRPTDVKLLFESLTIMPPNSIKQDSNTWVIANNTLIQIDSKFSISHKFDPPDGVLIAFDKFDIDNNGMVWFAGAFESKTGIYRYDPRNNSLINLTHKPGNSSSLASNLVYDIMVDSDHNVWVATDHGISVLRKQSLIFYNKDIQDGTLYASTLYKSKGTEHLIINTLLTGTKDNINQVMAAPIIPGRLDSINLQPILKPLKKGFVTIFYQGRKYFWINQWPVAVVGYPVNPKTGLFDDANKKQFSADPGNPNKISGANSVAEDSNGNILMATGKGIDIVSPSIDYGADGSVRHISSTKTNVEFFYPRSENSFWTLGMTGKRIGIFHEQSDTIENVLELNEMPYTIRSLSDGTLLIGTQNALYKAELEGGRYKFKNQPLVPDVEVAGIQEDQLGRIWIYGDARIICYDKVNSVTTIFGEKDGVDHCRTFYSDWFHKTSTGIIIAAGPNGLSIFDPSTFKISERKVNPVLTRLAINNKSSKGTSIQNDDSFTLPADISILRDLVVDYKHNNFTIEFAAMEMTSPEKNLYRHKLEGYDPDWIETDWKYRTATYTNLSAGEYTFRVKASNHHGVWSDQERTLSVIILPPPWRTWWAYSIYALMAAVMLFLGRKNIVQRERLKSNLKLEKVEREKEHFELEKAKEVDKVKSTFFANISHEFRTPLTLIKGPVQEMLEEFADRPKVKERMKLVERNADLVLKLINQLLDLAKLDSGTLSVEMSENDLNSFLTVVTNSFSSLALQKSVTLETELPPARNLARFDKDKVETILINLINNAIKFTPSGGSVKVRALVKKHEFKSMDELVLSVSDTGIGIAKDQQEKVFERFHQANDAHKEVGTGIGLSLVKELVALMEGNLSLKSESGKGSEFTIILPLEIVRVLAGTEVIHDQQELIALERHTSNGNQLETEGDNRPRVLVVEDNSDLRKFIIDCLGKEFHFLEAADGRQGMEKAFEEVPDLIVSDVMMPEMDGITMTGKLKKDTRTSHIPLILLTAKTSDESKLFGLGTGADDYLTKPFNKNELLLKVRNSIALRVKLREKIKLELLKESPKVEVQSADEQFLWKVKEAILARLSDEQLSVESLAEEIGLSRSQLLRKVTALTGVSVNELIRTFRLQKAAQLLERNWAPVTQIAYEVGFSNLSYFSKVFKEQYGVLPSEYATKVQ